MMSYDPEALAALTKDQVFALATKLTPSDHAQLVQRWNAVQNPKPSDRDNPQMVNTSYVRSSLNERLQSGNLKPTDASNKQQAALIYQAADKLILARQQALGRQLTDAEIGETLDGLMINVVRERTFWFDSTGPLLETKISDIPESTVKAIRNQYARKGINNPTDADILSAYWLMNTSLESRLMRIPE